MGYNEKPYYCCNPYVEEEIQGKVVVILKVLYNKSQKFEIEEEGDELFDQVRKATMLKKA